MSKQDKTKQVEAWISAHGVTQCEPGYASWAHTERESAKVSEKEINRDDYK